LSSSVCSNHSKAGNKKKIGGSKGKQAFISLFSVLSSLFLSPYLGIFIISSCLFSYISDIIRTFAAEKKKNEMDKYIILSPEAKGSFNDRLNFLYLKLGNFLDTEKLENRTLQYCKVFLSDAQNQIKELEESLLYQEFLKGANLTIVEQ